MQVRLQCTVSSTIHKWRDGDVRLKKGVVCLFVPLYLTIRKSTQALNPFAHLGRRDIEFHHRLSSITVHQPELIRVQTNQPTNQPTSDNREVVFRRETSQLSVRAWYQCDVTSHDVVQDRPVSYFRVAVLSCGEFPSSIVVDSHV